MIIVKVKKALQNTEAMHYVGATLFGQKYFILKTTRQKIAKP